MGTLGPKQRDKRRAVLLDAEHACWYCGMHAEQMSWDAGGTAICRNCHVTLARARTQDVPPGATREQKKHYLDTMRLLGRTQHPHRPVFTTALIKHRYPTRSQESPKNSPLRQKLLDRRNRDVG